MQMWIFYVDVDYINMRSASGFACSLFFCVSSSFSKHSGLDLVSVL